MIIVWETVFSSTNSVLAHLLTEGYMCGFNRPERNRRTPHFLIMPLTVGHALLWILN